MAKQLIEPRYITRFSPRFAPGVWWTDRRRCPAQRLAPRRLPAQPQRHTLTAAGGYASRTQPDLVKSILCARRCSRSFPIPSRVVEFANPKNIRCASMADLGTGKLANGLMLASFLLFPRERHQTTRRSTSQAFADRLPNAGVNPVGLWSLASFRKGGGQREYHRVG